MEFDNIIMKIADNLKRTLSFVPTEIKLRCEEIRLRTGLPVCLTAGGEVLFVCKSGNVCNNLPQEPLVATAADVQNTLSKLCNNSVYLHESEIKQGFVSIAGGCRAGVCGVFNGDGMLVSVSAINIRIARQIFNCAINLLPYLTEGLLIAGPPGCGKTTVLRDAVRLLSNGENGNYYRVSVIDSRGEISGGGMLDLGVNTDVLYTQNKPLGVDIALRTMFPHFIAFDEIGTEQELYSVQSCFNAGVGIITTAHCQKKEELLKRNVTQKIIQSGAVSRVALLSKRVGIAPMIFALQELKENAFA